MRCREPAAVRCRKAAAVLARKAAAIVAWEACSHRPGSHGTLTMQLPMVVASMATIGSCLTSCARCSVHDSGTDDVGTVLDKGVVPHVGRIELRSLSEPICPSLLSQRHNLQAGQIRLSAPYSRLRGWLRLLGFGLRLLMAQLVPWLKS